MEDESRSFGTSADGILEFAARIATAPIPVPAEITEAASHGVSQLAAVAPACVRQALEQVILGP